MHPPAHRPRRLEHGHPRHRTQHLSVGARLLIVGAGTLLAAGCSGAGGGTSAAQSPSHAPSSPPVSAPSAAGSSVPPSSPPPSPTPRQTSSSPSPSPSTPSPVPLLSGSPTASASGLPLAGMTVLLDPGSDGRNAAHKAQIDAKQHIIGSWYEACDSAGAQTKTGYPEHAFTFDVALRTKKLLTALGADVELTRRDDTGVGPCVTERAADGNRVRADAVVSIEADGAAKAGHGYTVILPGLVPNAPVDKVVGPSVNLGRDLAASFQEATSMPPATYQGLHGYLRSTTVGGLALSAVPKVYIDAGNMTNTTDAALMQSGAWRQEAAIGIASGIESFLLGR